MFNEGEDEGVPVFGHPVTLQYYQPHQRRSSTLETCERLITEAKAVQVSLTRPCWVEGGGHRAQLEVMFVEV